MAIIVRFFFHLILLSCIFVQYSSTMNDTNYILCTSRCSQVNVYFNDLLNLPPYCREESSYDYALSCGVTYDIHFDRQYVSIDFIASNDTNDLDKQSLKEILTQTTELKFETYTGYDSYAITRKFTCNTNKDCARDFYENTISKLVHDGKVTLHTIKDKLYNSTALIGPGSRRRCTDSNKKGNKTSVKCGHGLCYTRLETYEFDSGKNTKKQKCQESEGSYLRSEIERHSRKSTRGKEILEYVCNKNVCNRNDLIPKIQQLINDYIQWNPVQEEAKETPSSSRTVAEKTGKNFSIKQTIFSPILVSFVILLQFFI
ncbi:hypothetical protein I4U23_010085 [Adineta vaga]|nr:hypothetical protein I4U23_010085 [Adineta vaga]